MKTHPSRELRLDDTIFGSPHYLGFELENIVVVLVRVGKVKTNTGSGLQKYFGREKDTASAQVDDSCGVSVVVMMHDGVVACRHAKAGAVRNVGL